MMDFFEKLRNVNFVEESCLPELKRNLHHQAYSIYIIDGQNITDAETFFLEIRQSIPLDPPLGERVNWDALSDSAWSGLDELGKNKIAFIWTHAENMLQHGLPDLILAVECLKEISMAVSDIKTGIFKPIHLITFLAGRGDNFKPLKM